MALGFVIIGPVASMFPSSLIFIGVSFTIIGAGQACAVPGPDIQLQYIPTEYENMLMALGSIFHALGAMSGSLMGANLTATIGFQWACGSYALLCAFAIAISTCAFYGACQIGVRDAHDALPKNERNTIVAITTSRFSFETEERRSS